MLVEVALREQLRDAERVNAERVEALERGARELRPRDLGEFGRVRIGEPWEIDEADVLEVPQRLRRLAIVDRPAGIGRNRPEVRLHDDGVGPVDGEECRVDRFPRELALQQQQHLG